MIRSDAEYRRALAQLEKDLNTIDRQKALFSDMGITGAELERVLQPSFSFYEQLKDEVETYERMKRGDLDNLVDLISIGKWLIGIRIARGWSQKELAERLNVPESQVSRDERNEYHGVTVERAQRILEAMNVRFTAEIEDPIGTSPVFESAGV